MAAGSDFVEGDSVLSLSSPVFSSELATVSSLSAGFSGADAESVLEGVCREKQHKQTWQEGEREESWWRADRQVKRCLCLTEACSEDDKMRMVKV